MWTQWIEDTAKQYEPIAWALRPKRVKFQDGTPLAYDERLILALAMRAVVSHACIKIEHPSPNARIALAAATGLLLADHIARSQNESKRIPRDLVVITRQIGLALKELKNIHVEGVDIRDLWRVEQASSAQSTLGHGRPQAYIAPPRPGKLFPYSINAGAVVIDASHPLTLERLSELMEDKSICNAPIQILIVPLGYQVGKAIPPQWLEWTWDEAALQEAGSKWGGVLERASPTPYRRLLVCPEPEIDQPLQAARSKLALFSKHASQSLSLMQAWGLYNRLASLSVSLGIYEQHALRHHYARPLKDQLKHLASLRPGDEIGGRVGALYASEWRPLLDSLVEAYQALSAKEPGKFWGIANTVEDIIQSGFIYPTTIICSTEIEANILIRELGFVCTDLHRFLHPDALTVFTPRSFASQLHQLRGRVLTTGPFSSKWRYLDAALSNVQLVVYPHEVMPEKRALQDIQDKVARSSDISTRQITLERLGFRVGTQNNQTSPQATRVSIETIYLTELPERPSNADDPSDAWVLPEWALDPEDLLFVSTNEPKTANGFQFVSQGREVGPMVRVSLRDSDPIIVPQNYIFDVYRAVTDELDEREALQLEPGDILVLTDSSRHTRLFDRIIEALETQAGYASISVWLSIWEYTKQAALDQANGNYGILHRQLRDMGTTVVEGTVRSWFMGIMAPRDEQDIYRIIEISGEKAAIANRTKIRGTLARVRGMHRVIGRRISSLVLQAAVAIQPEQLIDDSISIAIEDVLAVTQRVVVERVESISRP